MPDPNDRILAQARKSFEARKAAAKAQAESVRKIEVVVGKGQGPDLKRIRAAGKLSERLG